MKKSKPNEKGKDKEKVEDFESDFEVKSVESNRDVDIILKSKKEEEDLDELKDKKNGFLKYFAQESQVASQKFKEENYYLALERYQEILSICGENKEDMKTSETRLNIAMCYYHIGNFTGAIKSLEVAHSLILKQFNEDNPPMKNLFITIIQIRVRCYLAILYFTICKLEDAQNYIELINEDILYEVNKERKLMLFREVLLILFGTTSLRRQIDHINTVSQYKKVPKEEAKEVKEDEDPLIQALKDESNNQAQNEKASRDLKKNYLANFLNWLNTKDIKQWKECLTASLANYKETKDLNGYLLNVINLQVASSYENINVDKEKLSQVIKKIVDKGSSQIKDKPIEKILEEMKKKVNYVLKLYHEMLKKETELELQEIEEKSNKEFQQKFITKVLTYAISYITSQGINSEESKQKLQKIKTTLELLKSGTVDLGFIDLFTTEDPLVESARLLLENLFCIKQRLATLNAFRMFSLKTLKADNRIDYIQIKRKIADKYFQSILERITIGEHLLKINFSTNGKKEHYYRLNELDRVIEYSKNNSSVADRSKLKSIKLDNVKKIEIGISSENLITKKRLGYSFGNSWEYLTLYYKDKTIDFRLREETVNTWYLGLSRYIHKENLNIKILTTFGFFIYKVKLKLSAKIEEFLKNNKSSSSGRKVDFNLVRQIVKFTKKNKDNHISMESIPFVQLLILYSKTVGI